MNKYPVWWDTTLTIYNKYENPETNVITWYRNVVDGCFWKYTGNKIAFSNYYSANNSMILETDDTICRIPKSSRYMESYNWINVPNDQKGDYFTLRVGDIIVRDEVEDVINEYQAGHRSTDLVAKYKVLQGCIEVTKVSNNCGAGRVDEHYYVKGV